MRQETRKARQVEFIAEPDAESEPMLKTRLVEPFRLSSGLIEACLVSAGYDGAAQLKLALCLRTAHGIPDFNFVKAPGEELAHLFHHTQSLDTLFLTPVQNQQMVTVAHPFYRRASTGNA